jgi:hypothetical protein
MQEKREHNELTQLLWDRVHPGRGQYIRCILAVRSAAFRDEVKR